ncbi:MAG: DNA ligase-associated DEXH box helicase, partial [Flammeovirgaceae bacterium]|nr:DNA ligase-associated DEXH box helicase [Flammeovirgaceae bacterium]
PNQTSRIYFVPVHALEVLELAALQEIVLRHKGENFIEEIRPLLNCFDVLIQYLVTLAVSDGFDEKSLFDEVRQTYCFQAITEREWWWCLQFITKGGESLKAYDEFTKVVVENGFYRVQSTKIALRHRLSIGTIVSEPLVRVQLLNGKYIGLVDESFIAKLNKGETFWLAGRMFALDKLKENIAYVVPSQQKKGHIPIWQGSRLVLSSSLAKMLRKKMQEPIDVEDSHLERFMRILLAMQRKCSVVPHEKQFLIEQLYSKEGFHLFFYPFAGRMVHELMAAWVAYRLSQSRPITFSLAMNDYGFELLSDQEVSISEASCQELFSLKNWEEDLEKSLNKVELARRKFREIAVIAGMIFQGYPSKQKRSKHLQASAKLLYDVLTTYEPNHLLIAQSFREAMNGLEKPRFFEILQSLQHQEVLIRKITKPTLLAFPIMVDRMRMQISSESVEDRIVAMQAALLKA